MNPDKNANLKNTQRLERLVKTLLCEDLLLLEFHNCDWPLIFGEYKSYNTCAVSETYRSYPDLCSQSTEHGKSGKWIQLNHIKKIEPSWWIRDNITFPPNFEEIRAVEKAQIERITSAQFHTSDIKDIYAEPYQIARYFCKKALETMQGNRSYFNSMIGFANFFAQVPFREITKTRNLIEK